MQGKNRRKPLPKLPPWVGGDPGSPSAGQSIQKRDGELVSIPRKLGTEYSVTKFPIRMEKYMVEYAFECKLLYLHSFPPIALHASAEIFLSDDGFTVMTIVKRALYPFEICLRIDPREKIWYDFLFIDPAFLHSVIFSAAAYFSVQRGGGMDTPIAIWHIIKALNILSERISDGDRNAITDSTISVVISLVMAADLVGDYEAAENHMRGLYQLITMRGGLAALQGDTWGLQSKAWRFVSPRLPDQIGRCF